VRLAEADKFVDPQSLLELAEGGGGAGGKAPARGPLRPPVARGGMGGAPAGASPGGVAPTGIAPAGAAPVQRTAPPAAASSAQAARMAPTPSAAASTASPAPTGTTAPAGSPPPRRPRTAEELKPLSTAEKQAIQNDPAVRETLKLFGGDVVDMRKEAPPEEEAEPEQQNGGENVR